MSSRAVFLAALTLTLPALAAPLPSSYDLEVQARRERFLREARSPAAVVPLLGLADLWELVENRDALVSFAEEATRHPAAAPDVQAYARFVLREFSRHRGDETVAARLAQELGLVQRCQIVGPFDNEGRRGHGTAYPPEQDQAVPAPETTYEGRSRAVPPRWRPAPPQALGRDGRLHLDAVLRPEDWVTAYAACYVRTGVQTPVPVAVRAGASGALKVWVNRGAPVIDRDVYRPLRVEQEVGTATLLPGWNRLLVKISATEGQLSFLLRLTAPDGRPLPGLAQCAEPPAPAWLIPRAVPARVQASSLLRQLQAAVRSAPRGRRAQALRDLGAFYHYVVPTDPELREAEAALAEAQRLQPTVAGARLLAAASASDDDRRLALQAGLGLPGEPAERARLLLDLGRLYEEARRVEAAEAAYREAATLDPALYTATIHLAQLQANRGLVSEAERLLRTLPGSALRLQRARLSLAGRRGRGREVEDGYLRLLATDRDDLEAQRDLLDRARGRGDVDGAIAWLRRVQRVRPELIWAYQEEVELLEGAGRPQEALAALDGLIAAVPGEEELHELRARLLLRLGRPDDATAALRRSLELRPQNPELRSYLRHLAPAARSGDDLTRAYRVDVKELLRPGRARADSAAGRAAPGDPARVLLDQVVTRVHDNGLSEVFTQRVVEVLSDQGARTYAEHEIRFAPETQTVQVKAARIYKKDGQVQEIAQQEEQDASEPWYGLYYDIRVLTLRFDGLQPGDVIDVEYVVADVGRRNLLSDYFGDLHFFQEEVPRRDSRYVLLVSEAGGRRPLYFNTPQQGPGWHIERTERLLLSGPDGPGRTREYRFRAVDVPRLESEAGMPGHTETASFLHVSTYRSWEEVARWYTGLVEEQLQSSPEIARAARAAVAGLRDERAKARAIYNFVVKKTRYVGLEFGIHGYKPYKVTQVFQRKFGDCKDKAALLKVMLREAGIDSSLVLARTRRNGDLPAEPASLAAFDHALVYVPKFDLFLDGTAEFSGSDELPEQDQDIPVLIVSDPRPPHLGRGHLARTPVLPAARNTVARELDVALSPDGSATVRERMSVAGQAAAKWREHYQAVGAQRERYEKAWNDSFPGVKVQRVEMPGIEDLERPVTVRGEVEVPAWGRPGGEGGRELALRPLGRDPDLLRNYARLSRRRHDLVLGFPWRNRERVALRLGPGLRLQRTPTPGVVESPFGRFVLEVAHRPAGTWSEVVVTAELEVNRHRISSADYPRFRRFCADVDALVSQDLVVGRE